MKQCIKCFLEKDDEEFSWKVRDIKRHTMCKECHCSYSKLHYLRNKDYYLKKSRRSNLKAILISQKTIYNYLISHPCVDCSNTDILVLEFDHRNGKSYNVSRMMQLSVDKILEEVAKCEVRCANCHRRRHAMENNTWKLKFASVLQSGREE